MIALYCMTCNHVRLALMPSYDCPRCHSAHVSWRCADYVDVVLALVCAAMRMLCWINGVAL